MKIEKYIGTDINDPDFDELMTDFLKDNAKLPKEVSHDLNLYLNNGTLYLTDEPMEGLKLGTFYYAYGGSWFSPNFADIPDGKVMPGILFRIDPQIDHLVNDLGIPKSVAEQFTTISVSFDTFMNTEELAGLIVQMFLILKNADRKLYDKIVNVIIEERKKEGGI